MVLKDKIEYTLVVVGEFARVHNLSIQEAFKYLKEHRGLEIIDDGYEIEHTFSIEDAVQDLTKYQTNPNFLGVELFDAPKELKILKFEGYTEKWVRFIIQNRDNKTSVPTHNYDIVVGPIADDTVGLQLFQYRKHYIKIENLI